MAIVGFFFTFLFAYLCLQERRSRKIELCGFAAWSLAFLGLLTSMMLTQVAWGGFWSWQPRETMTLLTFLMSSAKLVAYHEDKVRLTKLLVALCCILSVIIVISLFI